MPALATTSRPERVGGRMVLLDLCQPLNDWEPPTGANAACIFAAVSRLAAWSSRRSRSPRVCSRVASN